METNNSNRIYPGMLNANIEFFKRDNSVHMVHNGAVSCVSNAPNTILSLLSNALEEDAPALEALQKMVPSEDILPKFIWCRFGGLDFSPDIADGKLQDGEYHPCRLRGKCSGEGLVCKMPIYKGVRLSKLNVRLMQLLSTTLTNEAIASEMNLAMGTFHQMKKALYVLLGNVQTKQEVTLIAKELNIV